MSGKWENQMCIFHHFQQDTQQCGDATAWKHCLGSFVSSSLRTSCSRQGRRPPQKAQSQQGNLRLGLNKFLVSKKPMGLRNSFY